MPAVVPVVESVCGGKTLVVPVGIKPDTPGVAVAVHEKVAPGISAVKFTCEVRNPEQTVWLKGEFVTLGEFLTVKVFESVTETPHSLVTFNRTV